MQRQRVHAVASAPIALWIGLLLTVHVRATQARLAGPEFPVPVPVPSGLRDGGSPTPVERVGHGLSCVAPGSGLLPFSRCCVEGPCGRMSATRRLLVGAPFELARATAEDLEALPGIGPKLAARILGARAGSGSLRTSELASVRGIGARRAAQLALVLGLDEAVGHDICSSGSWPTTSSGCGKPP